jgi:hypothetical protein
MHRGFAALSLSLLALSSASAQRLTQPTVDTLNHHIIRTMNSGPSAWTDTNGWRLVYERTMQPKDGDPGELGDVSVVALLNDGRLVESETKDPSIRLFDATGHFVRMIGRTGDGPGEFRSPNLMLYHDTLVIHDPRLHRGTLFTLDGHVLRSFATVCCSFGNPSWIDDRGRMTLQGLGRGTPGQWFIIDVTGRRLDSLPIPVAEPPKSWVVLNSRGMPSATVGIPYSGQTVRRILHDGTLLYGATDHYQLIVSATDRDTIRIFGRSNVTAIPLRQSLRDSAFQFIVGKIDGLRAVAHVGDIPSTYPLWSAVSQDGNGNLWVDRGVVAGPPHQFDLFASDGRFLGVVPAPFAGHIGALNRDHVAVVDADENELPRIRVYRIDRRGH